jgi:hypothetical protein
VTAALLAWALLGAPPPLAIAGRLERGTVSDVGVNGFQLGARWQASGLGGALDVSRLDAGAATTALGGQVAWRAPWFAVAAGVRWQSQTPNWTPRGAVRLGPSKLHLFGAYALENPTWPGIGATRIGLAGGWRGFEGFAGYAYVLEEIHAGTVGVRAPLSPRFGLYISGALAPEGRVVRMAVGLGWAFGGTPEVLPPVQRNGAPPPMRGQPPAGQPPASQPGPTADPSRRSFGPPN